MSPRPREADRYPNLLNAIKETAWKQIAESGAATLSLRAIARELGISAPSIYNYYPSRDILVSALIVDAFSSLAEAQKQAVQDNVLTPAQKLFALGLSYRLWAVTYPQRYLLIFGTPIPNFQAPEDITNPPAEQAMRPLIFTLQEGFALGALRVERLAPCPENLNAMLRGWQTNLPGVELEPLFLTLIIWSRVHGLVMLEITQHLPPALSDAGDFFRRELENILIQYY